MSNVKLNEVTYPYVKIQLLNGQSEEIGVNLQKLYKYINEHKNMGGFPPYGNAFRIIKKRAQQLSGRNDVKFSKREIAALIRCYPLHIPLNKYIKIPYKIDYIFRAIFEITDELKIQHPLTPELSIFIDKIRRDSFYNSQSELFRMWCKGENETTINRHLHSDIFAQDSSLSQKF